MWVGGQGVDSYTMTLPKNKVQSPMYYLRTTESTAPGFSREKEIGPLASGCQSLDVTVRRRASTSRRLWRQIE
jgi:hypothetical protein